MLDDRYKVKYGAVADKWGLQKVLLPLSFGVSSLVLLDMTACLLQEQMEGHKGRCAFELVVVHIIEGGKSKRPEFDELAKKYHPVSIKYVEHDLNKYSAADFKAISVSPTYDVVGEAAQEDDIAKLLQNSSSRSLREDLRNVVYGDIFRHVACEEGCQTLLYGHSMTRLANEVLSLTVKGRGLTIHDAIADKSITYGNNQIHVIFPLRDILFAEVNAVFQLREGLSQFQVQQLKPPSRLIKNMTVEDLTTEYFENLDATGYASTASAVVKTAEKLGGPTQAKKGVCQICLTIIYHDPKQWLSNITVNTAAPLVSAEERAYAELIQASKAELVDGLPLTVCYGCTVSLKGAGTNFVWPVRSTKQEILDEFTLTDEE